MDKKVISYDQNYEFDDDEDEIYEFVVSIINHMERRLEYNIWDDIFLNCDATPIWSFLSIKLLFGEK